MKVHELVKMLQMCEQDLDIYFEHEGSGFFISAAVDKVFQITEIPYDDKKNKRTYVLLKEG